MKKIIAPIFLLFLVSCQDDNVANSTNPTATLEALTEYITVNQIFQDVGNNSGDAVLASEDSAMSSKATSTKADGAIITVSPLDLTTFPKTITVDFQSGVVGRDGVTRKGVITIVSTDWYRNTGSSHTTIFTNFYHNAYKVEGMHEVENLGKNLEGELEFSINISNGKITDTSGKSISYTESGKRTWIEGSDTPLNIWDDAYLLEGEQTGVSSKGVAYTLTVVEPLHFTLLPRAVESGILDVSVGAISDVTLNYGERTISIFGKTYPFRN